MTREEREELVREFTELRKLVSELNTVTRRIEVAADRAIEIYSAQGSENAD